MLSRSVKGGGWDGAEWDGGKWDGRLFVPSEEDRERPRSCPVEGASEQDCGFIQASMFPQTTSRRFFCRKKFQIFQKSWKKTTRLLELNYSILYLITHSSRARKICSLKGSRWIVCIIFETQYYELSITCNENSGKAYADILFPYVKSKVTSQ